LKETSAVWFEDIPMLVLQILIINDIFKIPELVEDGSQAIYLSLTTTILSFITSTLVIRTETISLKENFIMFMYELMTSKVNWIPYLNQMKQRHNFLEIDFGKL
jgi:hypothetical protein